MLHVLLTLSALVLFFYYFLWKPQLYWKSVNVKQGPAIPIFGDMLKMVFKQESGAELVRNIYNRFKDARYCGLYQATTPILMLRDPDLIKQITVKHFDHFVNHLSHTVEDSEPEWNKSLFWLTGDSWRKMRATLSPTFTASKMRFMFPLLENVALQYCDFYLKQNQNIIELELKDSFTRFANDVVANCIFGVQIDSLNDPENEFFKSGKDITDSTSFRKIVKFLIFGMAPKIGKLFKVPFFSSRSKAFFTSVVRDSIKVREEQNIVRPDMIHLLMEARKGRLRYEESANKKDAGFATVEESQVGKTQQVGNTEMTEIDIIAQAMFFLMAGFETISTVLSFLCYELAVNPDIQERLRQEVDETNEANNGKLSFDVLNRMKYLDMVISENLRKHPSVQTVDRVCTKFFTIQPETGGESPVYLKPGDTIWTPVSGIHNDEKYYPNPEKFDPERFSDENKPNIKPYTYIPFGSGPRGCIASRFGLMEIKTLIFHILTKFEIIVTDRTAIPIKFARNTLFASIEGGFWVGMKCRGNPVVS